MNVKLSLGNTPLSQILSQLSEGIENFDPSNEYINNYPFLTTTQAVKKLVNSENIAELDQWYTIEFNGDAQARLAELQ
ncbi:MAG: hypothetical protein AAFP02_19530, partial [Bacteroidota bacterium]